MIPWIRPLILAFLLWVGEAGLTSAVDPVPEPNPQAASPASRATADFVPKVEPWIIEGDSLWGNQATGSEISRPRIRHGQLRITALQGHLSPDRSVLILKEDVRIVDTLRVVTAETGIYRRDSRTLELFGTVRGDGPEGQSKAGELLYDRTSGHIELRIDPEISDSSRSVWAERIEYETATAIGEAIGDVRVLLRADSTWLYGRRARYDGNTGDMIMTGDPWLFTPGPTVEDDLTVDADTLRMNEIDRKGEALGNVEIVRGQVRATGEIAIFELARNRTLLYGDPVAIDPDGEIHADTLSIRLQPDQPDLLRAFGNVRTFYRPRERPGEKNVVLGDTLRATLQRSVITDLEMHGNAVSLFEPGLADARTGTGRNLSRARRIKVLLEKGEAVRVDLTGEASGIYLYPGASSLETLRSPTALDSLITGRTVGTIASDSTETGPRPGSISSLASLDSTSTLAGAALIEHFVRERNLDLPDSLLTPADRLFDERVEYSGDTIRFHVRKDQIEIRGRGVLQYRGSELRSEEIDFYSGQNLVTAVGQPTLADQDGEVVGARMTYRTDERQGMVYQGRTEMEGGYYYGEEIKKLREDALLVRRGDYTTCDANPPHYRFHSQRMKLILKDKILARPVVLHIRDIPIFAIPYYFFPIRRGRHSGIMFPDVEFGFAEGRGRFIRNFGYYWAINDYMDTKAWMDYYDEGPEIAFNGDFRYKVRYRLSGDVSGRYVNEKNSAGAKTKRWNFQGSHQHQLSETARISARAEFLSDQQVIEDYDFAAGVNETLKRQLKSDASFRKSWSRASLGLSLARTEYLDEEAAAGVKRRETLPSLSFDLNAFALGTAPDARGRGGRLPLLSSTYFKTSFSFKNSAVVYFDPSRDDSDQEARTTWALSDTRRIGPFLRLTPSISGAVAWFSEDNRGEKNQVGANWTGSVSAANTLYGTVTRGIGPLVGLRHVVEPSVRYSYSPEIEGALSSAKRSSMSITLNQRVHTKWGQGEDVIKKENVFTWRTSTNYDFLAEGTKKALSNLENSLQFRPFRTFDASYSTSIDPHQWVRQNFSLSTSLRLSSRSFQRSPTDTTRTGDLEFGEFGESELRGSNLGNRETFGPGAPAVPWELGVSHSYRGSRGSPNRTHTLNNRLTFSPSTSWRVSGSIYYDLQEKEFRSHSFSLHRDLHCWEFRFEYRSTGSYTFRINIKEIPEVKYEADSR